MSDITNETAVAAGENDRLIRFATETKQALAAALAALDLGMTPTIAIGIASNEIDGAYRRACASAGQPIRNHMLAPEAIELQARFALDSLFAAVKGRLTESECRSQFWAVFRRATKPSLTA